MTVSPIQAIVNWNQERRIQKVSWKSRSDWSAH